MAVDHSTSFKYSLNLQKSGIYQLDFIYLGRRGRVSLKTRDKDEAHIKAKDYIKHNAEFSYEGESLPNGYLTKCFVAARGRAMKKGISFTLTRKELDAMYSRSGGKCELTGIPFSYINPTKYFKRPFVPSIDRIDNSKGYSFRNCRIVSLAANVAMNEWGESLFAMLAKAYLSQSRVTGIVHT